MQNIVVKKDELLATLKKNRAEHRKIFEEALEGYRKELESQLERRLVRVKRGDKVSGSFSIQEPRDQTRDYDRAIRMIEMSVADQVTLTENDFAQYVMDDWGWQRSFLAANSAYSGTAIRKMSEYNELED